MVKEVEWFIEPPKVQYGATHPTLRIVNLGANEQLPLKVTNPTGETINLNLTADDKGIVQQQIQLVGGVGVYKFSCDSECYCLRDLCCVASECKVEDAEDSLMLYCNNLVVAKGMKAELIISGVADTPFIINHSFLGSVKVYSGITGNDGLGAMDIEVEGLSDTFIAIQNTNVSNPIVTTTPSNINAPALAESTGSVLVFKVLKSSKVIEQNDVFPITLQIQNTGDSDARVSIKNLLGDLIPDIPIRMELENIAKGATREFTYFVSASHDSQEAKSMNLTFIGEYIYGGVTNSWSHSYSVVVPPRKLNSGLMISSLLIHPSTVKIGGVAEMMLTISNVGETDISDVNLAPIVFEGISGQIGFNGVTIPKGQSYTCKSYLKAERLDTYLFCIDGKLVSGKAQGAVVIGSNELSTSLLVTGK